LGNGFGLFLWNARSSYGHTGARSHVPLFQNGGGPATINRTWSDEFAVPLNVEYTADIYAERIGADSDAGVDTRSTEAICADDFVFYTNGFELRPGCLDSLLATSLLDLYPIDMSGAPIANATSTSIGGARYVALSSDYGSASFYATTVACGDGYTFSFWNVVPPN
jgi:hypothetical protein